MSPIVRLRRVAAAFRLLRRLPPEERRMAGRAWRELLVARLQVSIQGVARVLDGVAGGSGSAPSAVPVDGLVAVFQEAATACVHGATCLPRSLALLRFLRHYGVESRLRIGARKTDEGWSGHAWLERNGRPLDDGRELVRLFAPFRETA